MRGRLVLAVISALVAAPSASAADDLTLDWSVADRLQGPATIDEAAPAKPLPVRVDVDVEGPCPSQAVFELDGAHVAASRTTGRCGFNLPPTQPGHHELTLTAGDQHASTEIDLRDLLVVSIGDSVASGEGNPDAGGHTWLEPRCHRSLLSGAAQAARAVELGDRHSAVSLVPLACSGAKIDEGLLRPYRGIHPDPKKGPLRPQVDVLSGLKRPIDAVLIYVGANDVNFGALVRFCIVADCPDAHFDPEHPKREAAESFPKVAEVESAALERLGARYDALAERLKGRIDPAKVIIVEYFDPLRDRQGDPCDPALPGVDAAESSWAQRHVLAPLNTEVRAAAARHGWQVVGGVAEAFRRHGICAGGQSWITRPDESALRELAIEGTLHPNADGHIATATLIAPVLAGTLGVGSGAEQLIGTSHQGYVRWWWLVVAAVGGAGVALAVRRVLSG